MDGIEIWRIGSALRSPSYDHVCDMDHDGSVHYRDLYLFTQEFGHMLLYTAALFKVPVARKGLDESLANIIQVADGAFVPKVT